jgi:hypothetical protein
MQLRRIIYYSLTVLHVLSGIFAHHQEHQTLLQLLVLYKYVTDIWYHVP